MTMRSNLIRTAFATYAAEDGGGTPAPVDPAATLYGTPAAPTAGAAGGDPGAPGGSSPADDKPKVEEPKDDAAAAKPADPVADPAKPEAKEGEEPAAEGDDKGDEPVLFDPAKISLPKGVEVDQRALEVAGPVIAELKLTQEQGQKLVEAYTAIQEKQAEAWEATVTGWVEQIKTDKTFGGDKFEGNLAAGNELIRKFGDAELMDYLVYSGAGNNPAVFRFVSKLAAAISEDVPIKQEAAAGQKPANHIDVLYGSTKKD